jgi:hypothetical protein
MSGLYFWQKSNVVQTRRWNSLPLKQREAYHEQQLYIALESARP